MNDFNELNSSLSYLSSNILDLNNLYKKEKKNIYKGFSYISSNIAYINNETNNKINKLSSYLIKYNEDNVNIGLSIERINQAMLLSNNNLVYSMSVIINRLNEIDKKYDLICKELNIKNNKKKLSIKQIFLKIFNLLITPYTLIKAFIERKKQEKLEKERLEQERILEEQRRIEEEKRKEQERILEEQRRIEEEKRKAIEEAERIKNEEEKRKKEAKEQKEKIEKRRKAIKVY